MACNLVVFGISNICGVMTHSPREIAQRQTFLETRNCIEARLTMQRENHKQVGNYSNITRNKVIICKGF